jgi:hypothetical protein
MEFIEAPAFSARISDYLDYDAFMELESALLQNPDVGDVMPGTGGFRKLRWRDPRRGKGRRGGLRIIYYYFLSDQQIWLMTIYNKDEAADLTAREKRALKSAIEAELRARTAGRSLREKKMRRKK